jgi:hypothetical protein
MHRYRTPPWYRPASITDLDHVNAYETGWGIRHGQASPGSVCRWRLPRLVQPDRYRWLCIRAVAAQTDQVSRAPHRGALQRPSPSGTAPPCPLSDLER